MCIRQELSAPVMYSAPVERWSWSLSRPMQTEVAASSTENMPPKPQHSSTPLGLHHLNVLHQRQQVLELGVIRHDKLAGCGQMEQALPVATVVQTHLVRKAGIEFVDADNIVQKLAHFIDAAAQAGMLFLVKAGKDNGPSRKPRNWPKAPTT